MPSVEMAGRAGIPPDKVYMFNGSRQSNNFTANAGGVGSTARVAISDVAFKNASLDEVRAVTGHEIGHYVLKHTWWGILFFSVAAIILFWLADRLFPRFARAFGSNATLGDPRGIPVLMFMVSLLRAAGLAAVQHVQPNARNAGRRLFAADRKPAGRAVDRAREDGRVSLSAAERGSRRSSSTTIPRSRRASAGDGVEGRASGAAHAIGEAFT